MRRLASVLTAALMVAGVGPALVIASAAAAAAQPNAPKGGEQRYEVTIAPPHRPGTPMPKSSVDKDEDDTGAVEDETAPEDSGAESVAPNEAGVADTPAQSAPASAAGDKPAATASAKANVSKTPAAPRTALQVGAYRQRASAEKLRETLSASFSDVTIVETTSGGEPLYRVRVGRIPRGPAVDDTKRRLLAAGYTAFEVALPDKQSH